MDTERRREGRIRERGDPGPWARGLRGRVGADAVRVSGVSGAVPGVLTAERRACVGPGAVGQARGAGTAGPHG